MYIYKKKLITKIVLFLFTLKTREAILPHSIYVHTSNFRKISFKSTIFVVRKSNVFKLKLITSLSIFRLVSYLPFKIFF